MEELKDVNNEYGYIILNNLRIEYIYINNIIIVHNLKTQWNFVIENADSDKLSKVLTTLK